MGRLKLKPAKRRREAPIVQVGVKFDPNLGPGGGMRAMYVGPSFWAWTAQLALLLEWEAFYLESAPGQMRWMREKLAEERGWGKPARSALERPRASRGARRVR